MPTAETSALADLDGGSLPDLVYIKKFHGEGATEVHVLSSRSGYQNFFMQTATGLHQTGDEADFDLADFDGDGILDLAYVKKHGTGSNTTELHVLSGDSGYQSFIQQTATGLHQTGIEADFALSDNDGDGLPDLVYIRKLPEAAATEVHILSSAASYQSFSLQVVSGLHATGPRDEFVLADLDRDGLGDLIYLPQRNTSSGRTELHTLSRAGNYQDFVFQMPTALDEIDEEEQQAKSLESADAFFTAAEEMDALLL